MTPVLALKDGLENLLTAHASACYPEEACGLVGGKNGHGERFIPVTNQLHSPVEFKMNPQEQLNAMLALEKDEMEIVAIFHSHPKGPAGPSLTDLQRHYYLEASLLIASPVPEIDANSNSEGVPGFITMQYLDTQKRTEQPKIYWQVFGYRIEDGKIKLLQVITDRYHLDA